MHGDVRIPLWARDGSVRAYTLVDTEDAEWVNRWRWCLSSVGYACRSQWSNGCVQIIQLHRALLKLTLGDGFEGDHIYRDRLDNRRSNLRVVPKGKNQQNVQSRQGAASRFRGVSWNKKTCKWRARVQMANRTVDCGCFTDEQEAAEAARDARRQLMPYTVEAAS